MKKFLVLLIVLSLASMANAGIVLTVDGSAADDSYDILAVPSGTLSLGILVEGTSPAGDTTMNQGTGMPTDGSTAIAGGDFKIQIRDASTNGVLATSGMTLGSATAEGSRLNKLANRTSPSTVFFADARPVTFSIVPQTSSASATEYLMTLGNLGDFNAVGAYTLLDDLEFHCEGAGDVYIDLIAGSNIITWDFEIGATYTYVASTYTLYYYNITGYTSNAFITEGTLIDSILVSQIPEPATLALLGLGGLFLRRRKK